MTKKDNWNYKQGATNTIEGATHVKTFSKKFSGNAPSRGKNMGESEFDIFEAKKFLHDSEKAYCVLKRKVANMRFLTKNDPFWGKNIQEIRI